MNMCYTEANRGDVIDITEENIKDIDIRTEKKTKRK